MGTKYSYTAQRVRSVEAGGQTLEVRSVPSAVVTVDVEDVFPPDAPSGLVSVPGVAGGVGGEAEKAGDPDLSWEPNMEPHRRPIASTGATSTAQLRMRDCGWMLNQCR